MKNQQKIYTGSDAGNIARQKARYGHKDWLVWKDREGNLNSAKRSAETLKMAMLANGTQGHFIHVFPDGTSAILTWSMAALQLRNIKWYL